jgi:ABC-type sulfate/molybdate transport systems ATPase subunit
VLLRAGALTLVSELSFALAEGESLALVGPNGSGKSTLLAALAGLLRPDAGSIERPGTPPGMLFQDGALWPHLSVEGHLAFVDRGADPAWRRRLLDEFALQPLRTRKPASLSGGERVRLGLARAFAGRPRWVLLDEPLAHVDAHAADRMRALLPALVAELRAASIVVVHDAADLALFGARVLCLSGEGPWWLGDTTLALAEPPTPALAALSRAGTVLSGVADSAGRVELGLGLALAGRAPGERVTAFLPSASVRLSANGAGASGTWVGPDPQGGSWVRADGRLLRCADRPAGLRPGDSVSLAVAGTPRELHPSGRPPAGRGS